MCPVCMTTVMLIAGGATSTGGLAVFVVKNSFKTNRNHQTNELGEKQNENRDNGTENRHERNESF
jgi:hypothetical protein